MSTVTETKDRKAIKPELVAQGEAYRKDIKIDGKTGIATGLEAEFEKALEAGGVDKETVVKIQNITTNFVTAAGYALGKEGNVALKKNKDLESVSIEIPLVGKDKLSFDYLRSKEVSDGVRDAEGKMGRKTVYGALSASIKSYATGNRGEFSKVKNELAVEASELFS